MRWWKWSRSGKSGSNKSTAGCTNFNSSNCVTSKDPHLLSSRTILPDVASLQLDDRVQAYLNQINSRQVSVSGLRLVGESPLPPRSGRVKSTSVGNAVDLAGAGAAEDGLSPFAYVPSSLGFTPGLNTPIPCSMCQKSLKHFGRPARKFSYEELEQATKKFSQDNFVAEGESEFVYKGLLPDGRRIAVKTSSHEDKFWAEVETLSSALHPNVITLVGFCVEEQRRLLVYDFICNGSLDWHLSPRNPNTLEWDARQKIAVNTAKSLRYLHEQCRLGCIVHRDVRSKNIYLTHDFEPVIGGFGFARWQADGAVNVKGSVVGTPGYLAPEYAESGQVTEKVDVFSFGIVLLELISGRKAIDFSHPISEQQFLADWARPFLEDFGRVVKELLDTRIGAEYHHHELYCMVNAAGLCIRKDPIARPNISQVLCILEGENYGDGPTLNGAPIGTGWYNNKGSTSFRERQGSVPLDEQFVADLRYPSGKLSSSSRTSSTSTNSSSRLGVSNPYNNLYPKRTVNSSSSLP